MSRREYQRAVEESLREHKPLRVAEPPVKVGKGDKAFKTLTAAVKAAEREKRAAQAAAEEARMAAQGALNRFLLVERQMFWWSVGVLGVLVIQVGLLIIF